LTDVYWRDSQQYETTRHGACHVIYRLLPQTSPNAAGAARGSARGEQPVFVDALPGATSFAACLRLFRSYPLAVTPAFSAGWHRSIVIRHRAYESESQGAYESRGAFDGSGYFVLTQDPAGHFTLRPWRPGEGECQEIRPAAPVPMASHRVVAEGMPVPRDGALLGWVSDRQVTVLLSVHHGDPASQRNGPQVRALAMVGSEPMRWPPFTTSPLDDGRLWEYVERGEIVDLAPLIACNAGGASWVPSQHPGRAGKGHGCVVVGRNMQAAEYWVPAGTYMDHWMLREGVPSPPATHLLTLPGTTDLSRRLAS
jgi:hypothetical protein